MVINTYLEIYQVRIAESTNTAFKWTKHLNIFYKAKISSKWDGIFSSIFPSNDFLTIGLEDWQGQVHLRPPSHTPAPPLLPPVFPLPLPGWLPYHWSTGSTRPGTSEAPISYSLLPPVFPLPLPGWLPYHWSWGSTGPGTSVAPISYSGPALAASSSSSSSLLFSFMSLMAFFS